MKIDILCFGPGLLVVVVLFKQATPTSLMPGLLSDPESQPMFEENVVNALDPAFKLDTSSGKVVRVSASEVLHSTGLVDNMGSKLKTPVWGYGPDPHRVTWPGSTFEVMKNELLTVTWTNNIRNPYLLTGVGDFDGESVMDPTLHWAYGLHNCRNYTIFSSKDCGGMASLDKYGMPLAPHVHGSHSASGSDGNPEFFFSRGYSLRGPRFVRKKYVYQNTQPAGSLWYHDHALGVTRLNVYAGLAGFYFIRDEYDTGKYDNSLHLPAYPYEAAFAIQDRMFKENGELFFPAFEGDPGYADFIDADIQKKLPNQHGPSVLTEFFGDHMVVNGKIWPKMKVEPRKYRLRLLNGCDSRFLLLQFVAVDSFMTEIPRNAPRVPFTVIGSDQGLAERGSWTNVGNGTSDFLVFDPGARYDIIVDFQGYDNKRIIMRNLGADSPFNGELDGDYFENRRTDRIMAFDVMNQLQIDVPEKDMAYPLTSSVSAVDTVEQLLQAYAASIRCLTDEPRRVSLFEGQDTYGRLQPMMGPVLASEVQWPSTPVYEDAGLVGGMEGAVAWHTPTPETIACNAIETWEIWNPTADAHPIHLHLVHFHVLDRYKIKWDSNADAEGTLEDGASPRGDGTYLVPQNLVEHSSKVGDPSTLGHGFRVMNPMRENVTVTDLVGHHFIGGRRDTVVALPGQVTTIRMIFDRPGRYVWHCHILSHEDHNMMHVLQVQGPCN